MDNLIFDVNLYDFEKDSEFGFSDVDAETLAGIIEKYVSKEDARKVKKWCKTCLEYDRYEDHSVRLEIVAKPEEDEGFYDY